MDYKRKNFLDLNNNNNLPTKPTYLKDSVWLKYIKHSNTLCTHAIRAITNHAPISKYHLKFFPKKSFAYLCREYPIKSRNHILNGYK